MKRSTVRAAIVLACGIAALWTALPDCRAAGGNGAIVIDPRAPSVIWQGWGTALAWWANELGDRDDLANLLFTTGTVQLLGQSLPGLGLNIARYNLGACSWGAVDGAQMGVSRTIFPFRQMQGFWLGGHFEDARSADWNWNVDANQRAALQKAQRRGANYLELFSNSPMWWMCANKNPSGAAKAADNNLAPGNDHNFAVYLATVAQYARSNWGINFTTVEPFNEPSSNFWGENGKQEGCHFSPQAQAALLPVLRQELDRRGLANLPIAASDENTYDEAVSTWKSFDAGTRAIVGQINVHGYQGAGGDRGMLSRIAMQQGKHVWNSEYGDTDGTGLKMAANLSLDFTARNLLLRPPRRGRPELGAVPGSEGVRRRCNHPHSVW